MSEYYGDKTRWFIATVVNSTPPAGYEGRVKIRVHGLHTERTSEIPEEDLPWAQCVLPTTEGGVSGIGKIPRILPSALVFGMFMDGKSSQTPIVLGSLPKIERPSQIQLDKRQNIIGEEVLIGNLLNIEDDVGFPTLPETIENRVEYSLQFFLNLGYTYPQSVGITDNLLQQGMYSGNREGEGDDVGIGSFGLIKFKGMRLRKLKAFSTTYTKFTSQLKFIAYELNGEYRSANIRLLESERIKGLKGSLYVFSKYYMKLSSEELDNLKLVGEYENG